SPPFGFTSRLRRETLLQRWIHRKATLWLTPRCAITSPLLSKERGGFGARQNRGEVKRESWANPI
ncbi:hypothetical protein, partial [Brasilonema bromeliae]|uniref:hypothetical protein n=1 Tax=Brasilonema bromeliae TaxID=383615 RepID=UPI001B7D1C7E